MYFRKKPNIVEAVQLIEGNDEAIIEFCTKTKFPFIITKDYKTVIRTVEDGSIEVNRGDWIVHGVSGDFYKCNPDTFDATYDPI